jgi:hypothetical protein
MLPAALGDEAGDVLATLGRRKLVFGGICEAALGEWRRRSATARLVPGARVTFPWHATASEC